MTGEFDVCLHGKRLSIAAAAVKELATCPSREPESGTQKREVRELLRCRLCGARGFVYACVVLVCAVTNALDFAIRPVYSAVSLTLLVLSVSPGVMWYCGCREPQGHSKIVLIHMLVLHSMALVGLLSQTDWRQTSTNPMATQVSIFVVVVHALMLQYNNTPHANIYTQAAHRVAYSSLFVTSLVLRGVGDLDMYVRLSDSVFVLVSLVYYDYSLNVAK